MDKKCYYFNIASPEDSGFAEKIGIRILIVVLKGINK